MTIPKPAPAQVVRQSLRVLCATRERLRRMEERHLRRGRLRDGHDALLQHLGADLFILRLSLIHI